ncbi:MAG TPA: aminopeptidase P family N-terminal domain-containing protein, partial [Dissulfurispiraceae bacterium]|nr:aminopeptidase P family N-terminal domain-containing protein [Dissulfurispiraceae bacterium]
MLSVIESRVKRLRRIIRRKSIDALLITNIRNIRYLTGFTGSSAFALITGTRSLFFTDFRYTEQAEHEVLCFERLVEKGKRIQLLQAQAKKMGISSLGFEASASYEFYDQLCRTGISLLPQNGIVEKMRMVKDESEIAKIREAIRRAEEAFLAIKPKIRPGVTERKVALMLEDELKKRGCLKVPFDIIIASGRHSSMPHAGQT